MIWGVVLAGGASRRMGADKAAMMLDGETFLQRAVRRLAPQVDRVVVNAPAEVRDGPSFERSANEAWLERFGDVEIVPDTVPGRAGPLAGVLAAMTSAEPDDAIVTVAVDTPFFPDDLVERLAGSGIAFAASAGRTHPVFAFWPAHLRDDLQLTLEGGERKILAFAERHGYRTVEFAAPPDPFFNINTPADLEALAPAP